MNINNFFNPNNAFFRFMGRLTDLMILNFTWIICSLPVITIGASTTALYNTTLKMIDESEGYLLKNFFKAFKESFKKATLIWLDTIAFTIIIYVNLNFWIQFKSIAGYITISIVMFITFLFLLTNSYVFPILSSFNVTVISAIKKACVLALRFLPYSIMLLAISVIFFGAIVIFPIAIIFMIFIGVALYAFINSYVLKIVFGKSYIYLQNY